VVNNSALMEGNVLTFILLYQLIMHIPKCLSLGVDGLSLQFVKICLNGCFQHFFDRLCLFNGQTFNPFDQSGFF